MMYGTLEAKDEALLLLSSSKAMDRPQWMEITPVEEW